MNEPTDRYPFAPSALKPQSNLLVDPEDQAGSQFRSRNQGMGGRSSACCLLIGVHTGSDATERTHHKPLYNSSGFSFSYAGPSKSNIEGSKSFVSSLAKDDSQDRTLSASLDDDAITYAPASQSSYKLGNQISYESSSLNPIQERRLRRQQQKLNGSTASYTPTTLLSSFVAPVAPLPPPNAPFTPLETLFSRCGSTWDHTSRAPTTNAADGKELHAMLYEAMQHAESWNKDSEAMVCILASLVHTTSLKTS
jgi:hypothetical protein